MGSPPKNRTVFLVPALVAALILAATLLLVSVQREAQLERLVSNTKTVEASFAGRLETHLDARLSAARLLTMQLSRRTDLDPEVFQLEAEILDGLFSGFEALSLIDSSGVTRIIAPAEENAEAQGTDLRTHPHLAEAFDRAISLGQVQVTAPFVLADGATRFALFSPIPDGGALDGALSLVFRAQQLVDRASVDLIVQGYTVEISDGTEPLAATGPVGAFAQESVVGFANRSWRLRVAPTPTLIAASGSKSDEVFLGLGIFAACFVAALVYVAMLRQDRLRKSQARMEDFTLASSDCFWEMDADQIITWATPGVEDLFGISVDQFVGLKRGHFRDVAEGGDSWEAHFADMMARRPFRDFVYAVRVDGQRKWIRTSGIPLYDEVGKFQGYRGTANDATELVRTRNEVARSREWLETAVEELSEMFSLGDEDDKLIFGNKVFRELNKNIPHVLVPGTSFETYLREGVDSGHMRVPEHGFDDFFSKSLKRRHDPAAEPFEIERADGIILRLREQKLDGLGIVTIGQDVTEQRRNEEALRASEERLALAVQNLSIWDWDLKTDALYMSPGFAKLLGYTPAEFREICAAGVPTIVHPDDLEGYHESMRAHLRGAPDVFENEHRFRCKSGDYRWFLGIGHAVLARMARPVGQSVFSRTSPSASSWKSACTSCRRWKQSAA